MRGKSGGFGYAIDYDKAIVEDRRRIAVDEMLIRLIERLRPGESLEFSDVIGFVLFGAPADRAEREARGAILGLTPDDVEAIYQRECSNCNVPPSDFVSIRGERFRELHALSEAVYKRLPFHADSMPKSMEEARKRLRDDKSALARHLRNQKKYGKGAA